MTYHRLFHLPEARNAGVHISFLSYETESIQILRFPRICALCALLCFKRLYNLELLESMECEVEISLEFSLSSH
jgi:hypothetical protein